MTRAFCCAAVALVLSVSVAWGQTSAPGVALVGKGTVAGNASDRSGQKGQICQDGNPTNCVPKNILGGFGSGLAYTGYDHLFIAAPDRGPFDGLTDVPYLDRVHFLHITTDLRKGEVKTALLDTRFLRDEHGRTFVGSAADFDLRLDPEGIRVGRNGHFYISDEYGPYVLEFNPLGRLVRRLDVPSRYAIANPSSDPNSELTGNTSGRQANRGMEGLAITPSGRKLYGIMQNALIQDDGLSGTSRVGLNNRILQVDLVTGDTREFVYVVEAINRGQGVSEILAINDHEFLVLERDNRSNLQTPPQAPTRKKIWKIDLKGATDVSCVDSLPEGALPPEIVPVSKTLFIDLLDPAFNLAPTIAEKIEGLAWGPDLADGRHVLYVISDNDLNPVLATQIFAFAIDPGLVNYRPQALPGLFHPPGHAMKDHDNDRGARR